MSSNPRRTPVTRPDAPRMTLQTNMVLRKSATFHSPTSPSSASSSDSDLDSFTPPSLPRRSLTNLDDVVDAHRRRVALTLGNIDKTLAGKSTSSTRKSLRDTSLPLPLVVLDHTLAMKSEAESTGRVLRSHTARRSARQHLSDSGLGSSLTASSDKDATVTAKSSIRGAAVTRSAALSATSMPGLSSRAYNRIVEHTIKPILSEKALELFHPIVRDCPRRMSERKDILCLRDLEKILILTAPDVTKVADLYLEFCLTTVRCIQATVEFLSDREQTRPHDAAYTQGYFIDLVEQIRQYAQQLAEAKEKGDGPEAMDLDASDEIKLHGGLNVNGRPAELVRIKKDGKAISMATGEIVESIEEESKGVINIKRSASEELEDEDEIMRSMARRKKNATPEELAPKKCREPGCNKEFKRPCDLTKHEKTHSRPWKCPVPTCKYHEYGWPTEKEMDRHHNDKHSAAPAMYECLYKPCPYKSKRLSNCKQHMEKAHGYVYNRTKTNGKKPDSIHDNSSIQQTPNLLSIPTPPSTGIATPPEDHFRHIDIEFPSYLSAPHYVPMDIPQELTLDYSPVETTPSTDSHVEFGMPVNSLTPEYTPWEDIYSANVVQIPSQVNAGAFAGKELSHHQRFPAEAAQAAAAAYAAATSQMQQQARQQAATQLPPQAHQTQPQGVSAPHFSPIGQGNTMLYTPSSLGDVDEGFDDGYSGACSGPDFMLYPAPQHSQHQKAASPFPQAALFGEIPSVAAGYSQPSSQDFLAAVTNWSATSSFQGYPSQ